jgi:hypothetical protein
VTQPSTDIKVMPLRYDGVCTCGAAVVAGTRAGYDRVAKKVVCPQCLDGGQVPSQSVGRHESAPTREPAPDARSEAVDLLPMNDVPVESGRAGGSAMAEYERRSAKRESTIRAKHPKLGGLILALSDDPSSTRVWKTGGIGEQRIGAALDGLAGDGVLVLHDRKIPRSRANIDHIAIGPSGIFVIDAKRYVDAKVEVRRSGGLFSPVTERLVVRGRDQTKLVAGLAGQVAAVYDVLEDLVDFAHVDVQAVIAFVDANLPMFGSLEIAGVPILGPKGTAKLVRRPGLLDAERRGLLHAHLAARLPAYTP